jgi:hypothetical protein
VGKITPSGILIDQSFAALDQNSETPLMVVLPQLDCGWLGGAIYSWIAKGDEGKQAEKESDVEQTIG